MKRIGILFILGVSAMFADPIGKTYSDGNVSILAVTSLTEVTVFAQAKSCNTVGIVVTLSMRAGAPSIFIDRVAKFVTCNLPVKMTFPTEGFSYTDIRYQELVGVTSGRFLPEEGR